MFGQTTSNPVSLCYHDQMQYFILLQTSVRDFLTAYIMHMHNCPKCLYTYIVHVKGCLVFNCLVTVYSGTHSVHSLMHAKHALGSTIWCIVEPHHHAEGVLVLSPDIEVTTESAVPPPLSVASHPGWRLFASGCGAAKSTLSGLAYTLSTLQ